VREDVVAIKGLKVGVFTEVLSAEIDGKKIEDLSTFQYEVGDQFAKTVSDNFEELSKVHPSFLRLQGLDELVALSKAIEEMEKKPGLDFWLKDYQVKQVKTKREVKVLERKEDYEVPVTGGVYRGYLEDSGGVQLMAIALRLKAGDVTALKEAVLKTRPKPHVLSWSFVVGEWLIPTAPGMLKMEDILPLFTQALFLHEKKYYDDAITLYGKIIELKPDWDWPYNNRGNAYADKGLYDQAISDYNKALKLNPKSTEAYNNRGIAYCKKDQYDQAIADYNKALNLNSVLPETYCNRGIAYFNKGQYDQAFADYNKALELNPSWFLAEAYNARGYAYYCQGQYDHAIANYKKALGIDPSNVEAQVNLDFAIKFEDFYAPAISDPMEYFMLKDAMVTQKEIPNGERLELIIPYEEKPNNLQKNNLALKVYYNVDGKNWRVYLSPALTQAEEDSNLCFKFLPTNRIHLVIGNPNFVFGRIKSAVFLVMLCNEEEYMVYDMRMRRFVRISNISKGELNLP